MLFSRWHYSIKRLLKLFSCILKATRRLQPWCKNATQVMKIQKLSRYQIHRTVNRFKQIGSVDQTNNGRPKTSRGSENVSKDRRIIEETPKKSFHQVLGTITHKSNYSSVYRMLRFDLKFFSVYHFNYTAFKAIGCWQLSWICKMDEESLTVNGFLTILTST